MLKKLTRSEYDARPLGGSSSATKFFDVLFSLNPDEACEIPRADWGDRSYPPTAIARYIEKKYKRTFKINRLADGTGWVMLRVK